MRTKFVGSILFMVGLTIGSVAGHFIYNHFLKDFILLPEKDWMCFAAIQTPEDKIECVILKRKDIDLGRFPNSRRRNHNQEQGTSIHSQQ